MYHYSSITKIRSFCNVAVVNADAFFTFQRECMRFFMRIFIHPPSSLVPDSKSTIRHTSASPVQTPTSTPAFNLHQYLHQEFPYILTPHTHIMCWTFTVAHPCGHRPLDSLDCTSKRKGSACEIGNVPAERLSTHKCDGCDGRNFRKEMLSLIQGEGEE